jgi:hypothetical protein
MKRGTGIIFGLMLSLAVAPPAAIGATSPATIDNPAVELAKADGGGWTTSVGLTNLTNRTLRVTPKPALATAGCNPTLDNSSRVLPARQASFKVTIPAACAVGDKPFRFKLTANAGKAVASFAVAATLKKEPPDKPDWNALWSFAIALGGMAALMILVLFFWKPENPVKPRLDQQLPYLDDAWSFKDSWVSNITVVGGLLAGVFASSEVLKSILGEDSDASLALATVGGAIAAALIAAAGILVLALKTEKEGYFTVGGLLAASAIALAGAAGQVWVVYESARKFDLGGLEDRLLPIAIAALVLLVLYAYRSLRSVLVQGTTEPPAVPSDAVAAATLIVHALKPEGSPNTMTLLEGLKAEGLVYDVSPDYRPRPRRSALP